MRGGGSDSAHRVWAAGAAMGQHSGCPIAWWHGRGQSPCPALRAGGWRSSAGREDEPGGRLQPGCEAAAGLACVCPDRRAPARPLMGKACGQTSGSGTGNTQSIIGASGFLHCLTPASPERRCRPAGTGSVRREKECPVRAVRAGQQEGLEPQRDLPVGTAGHAGAPAAGGTRSVGAAGASINPPASAGSSCGIIPLPCGRLGADRVGSALGQPQGSGAFGCSGIFSPTPSVLPPSPAATGTRRARPREAGDERQRRGRAERVPVNPSHLIAVWSCCYL